MILASNCYPIKGYLDSIIYDIQRECYYEIDNETFEIFNSGKLDSLSIESQNFFLQNEVILNIEPLDTIFEPLSIDHEIPFHFNSMIFETSNCAIYFLELLNQKYRKANLVKYIYICDSNKTNFIKIQELIKNLDIIIYINSKEKSEDNKLVTFPLQFKSNISPQQNFSINPPTFFESQSKNVFYNKVLCINSKSQIVKTVNFKEKIDYSLSNLENPINLEKVISKLGELLFWNISKNEIDVCKDCKYRYMCYDNCEIVNREDDTKFRYKECNYNPYISKWDTEVGYLTLAESGVICNYNEFSLDQNNIVQINNKIWRQ